MTGLSESQVYKWNWDQRKKFTQDFDQMEAEVTRDEFGGYCCKRWGKNMEEEFDEDNICQLLGFDVDSKALELVRADLEKRLKSGLPSKALPKQSLIVPKKELTLKLISPVHTPKK